MRQNGWTKWAVVACAFMIVGNVTGCVLLTKPTPVLPTNPTYEETKEMESVTAREEATEQTTKDEQTTPNGEVGFSGKTPEEYKIEKTTLQAIDRAITEIIEEDMTKVEKVRAVNDWLVKHVYYDDDQKQHSPDEVIQKGIAVCSGYSEVFQIFMEELGISSVLCTGFADGDSHEWNAVQMDDGKWYYIDVTWGDPVMNERSDYEDGRNLSYDYFLIPREQMDKDHVLESEAPNPEGTSFLYNEWGKGFQSEYAYLRWADFLKDEGYNTFGFATKPELEHFIDNLTETDNYAVIYLGTDLQPSDIKEMVSASKKITLTSYGEERLEGLFYVLFGTRSFEDEIQAEIEQLENEYAYPCYYVESEAEGRAKIDEMLENGEGVILICPEYYGNLVTKTSGLYGLEDNRYWKKTIFGSEYFYLPFIKK